MSQCEASALYEAIAAALPSLFGTIAGGLITLFATYMTIKHQNELEDRKRREALEDERRR